jgi:EmrB/QacA subfamily drug resistance transporter
MKQRSQWLIFSLVAFAQFMVVLDSSITNVALPSIKLNLAFTNSSLQWVVTAYVLTFGGFLLLGGRAADLFGRRKTLLIGMGLFTTFSLLIGLSHSTVELITLRALQGMAAALMSPSALSIVLVTFRDGPARNRALGYWTLVATGGAALGLLLGGILTQYLNWRWNFFINVPFGIVISTLIYRLVPVQEQDATRRNLDLGGAMLVTSSLIGLVFAFSQAPSWGWHSAAFLGTLGTALLLMLVFAYNESKVAHPLIPLSIFKIRNVTGANLIMAPIYAGMLGVFFVATLYIQTILDYSPVKTGLAFLPFPIVLGFMSTRIPKLVARYGFKRFLIVGPLLVAIGLAWLSRLPVDGSYLVNLLPAFLVIPAGMGMTFMPIIAAATSGVRREESGLASGLITTSQQMGGALGLSILSGVAASVTASSLGMTKAQALVRGFDAALLLGSALMVGAALLAVIIIKQPKRATQIPTVQPEPVPTAVQARRHVVSIDAVTPIRSRRTRELT